VKPISGKKMCKVLERDGWRLSRISKSSHHIYKKPGVAAIITVPVHANKDLRPGTQATIMQIAGLSDDHL
jgi:predicted RNA binding protein YcfA (HicA-like mRNA interferase family)